MADQGAKISSLPDAAQADIQTTDVVAGVSGGATKKITFATVLAWIAARLSKSDVGLGNVDDIRQYSASNPPPYPVTSVNGETGAVSLTVPAASSTTPAMDGTADAGSSSDYARGDHVHPTDTTRQALITATGVLAGDGSGGVSAITVDSAPDAAHTNDLISSAAVAGALTDLESDLAAIHATGTTNTTGAAISSGTYFYLNGTLAQAKADIAIGATFTSGTNYTTVTAGGLNSLNSRISANSTYNSASIVSLSAYTTFETAYVCPMDGYVQATTSGHYVKYHSPTGGAFNLVEGNGTVIKVFVRKGMKLSANGDTAKYTPLDRTI